MGKVNGAAPGTTNHKIAVPPRATTTIPIIVTTILVCELCVKSPALFCTRTGRWESVGCVKEESRPIPEISIPYLGHRYPKINRIDRHSRATEPSIDLSLGLCMPQLQIKNHTTEIHFFSELLPTISEPLNMVLIEGGTFQMGSPETEIDQRETESPQHNVTVPSFFMSAYLITQAQWSQVAQLPKVNRDLKHQPSRFENRAMNPVESINWYEAVEFCDRLAAHTKRKYRLPSEAEWEYACRAGSKEAFNFGKTTTTDVANYDGTDAADGKWSGSYGDGPKGIYRQKTTPVDQFLSNAYGLYDMHGNVWEWCLDHWHNNYQGAPTDGTAWLSLGENISYVIRGGSWDNGPQLCRSASRNDINPDDSSYIIGLRVVCEIPRTL